MEGIVRRIIDRLNVSIRKSIFKDVFEVLGLSNGRIELILFEMEKVISYLLVFYGIVGISNLIYKWRIKGIDLDINISLGVNNILILFKDIEFDGMIMGECI